MKEIRNRNKIGLITIFHIKAFVSTKLYRQLTSLMMSIVISTVTVLGNTTVALADKKDDVINRIIEQYENGDISRDEAKRALIRNGVTNSPIIDLNEDEDGNELATDSDLVKKLGEKDRLIDEKIRKIIEDNRDDDTSVVFAWHHEDADSIIDELYDVATKSELKKSEADDNQESKKSVGIYYDKFNKTNKSSENADSETESENIEEAVDTEDDAAVDEESVSEDEVSDENQASEEMMEDDSLDEENEDSNSVDESVDPYAFFMNQLQADENETFESVEENEGFENNSQDEEAEVSESVNPYEFFMNQFQNEETEVSDSVEEDEVSEDDSQDEEDVKEDSDSVEEDEVLGNDSQNEEDVKEEENSDSVETAEADENESEDEEKEENSNIIKVDKFFEIDSYVENEDSDPENSEEETTEAETEAAKAIGIMAHSDKNAIAQTAEDADAEIEAETETKAAKAIGILAHSEKTATAQTEETTEAAEEEKDYDVIDLSEYVTVSSAVKKFHEEWIESESFDSGNKIGLTLYFSIPEDVMYDKDTRVAAYSMPEGLTSQFEGKGKVISGDETVGTYKLKKNEIEITFDTAFVKSGKSIEGALFFKGRVENNTDEDCLTIELGGTAGSLDVYKEIKKTVVSDDGKVTVTATFGASTFDGDVTLYADSLDEETRNDIINAYNEKLSEEERQVADLYLYDVYFLDEEGNKIEPDGHVSVKMSLKKPVESGDAEGIKVIHVKDSDPSDIEDLTSMEDTVINENSKGEVKEVELVSDSFSPVGFVTLDKAHVNVAKFLSGMSIKGVEETKDGWKMKNKEPYTLYLTFSEVSGDDEFQFPDSGWMYYTIPDNLYIKEKEDTFNAIIDNKYTIKDNIVYVEEATRRLYFQWNVNDPNIEYLRSATDLKVTAELTGYVYQKAVEFKFQNGDTKYIYIDKKPNVTISKTGYFNTSDNLLHYTLTVNSSDYCENVVVTDTLSGSYLELVTNKDITVTSNKQSNINETIVKNEKDFTVTIPKMEKGETITIKYRAKLKSLPEKPEFTSKTVGNTAKVKVDETVQEFPYDISYKLSNLKKSTNGIGPTYRDEDTPYGYIDYVIETNNAAGITYIKDTISENNRSYTSFYGDGIKVYVNDSKTPISYKWEDLTLEKDSSGKAYGWKWNIPNDINKASSFKITYTTKVYRSYDESRTIKNKVETNRHDPVEIGTTVNVLTHKKEVNKEVVSYDNTGVIWKLSFKVPAEGLDMALIKDDLPRCNSEFKFSDTLDTTFGDIKKKPRPEYPIEVEGLVGDETYVVKGPYENSDGGDGYRLKIAFFKDKNKDLSFPSDNYSQKRENDGLTNTGKERTITITYRTINNQNWINQSSANLSDDNYKKHINKSYFFINNWMEERDASVTLVSGRLIKKSIYSEVLNNVTKQDNILLIGYDLVFSVPDGYNDEITFIDKYDDNLSFVDPSEKDLNKDGEISEIPYKIVDIGKIFYDNSNMEWPQNDSGKTVKLINDPEKHIITIKVENIPRDKNNNNKFYQSYRIRYYLKIDLTKAGQLSVPNDGKVSFGNSVKWGNDLSAQCSVDYTYKTLDKGGWYDQNDGLAKYTIAVNPSGVTLNNGNPIQVDDVYSDNQIIDITSIVVKEYGHNEPITNINFHMEDVAEPEGFKKLVFENLPDSKRLIITYNSLPLLTSTNANDKTKLTNTATLLWSRSEANADAYFNANLAASGTTLGIKIVKHDSVHTSTLLDGAVFDLYKVADNGTKVPFRYKDDTEDHKKGDIVQFVTGAEGEKGVAEISLNTIETEGNVKFAYNQLYCLIESKAPDGYQLDKVEEHNVYYFAFAKTLDEANYDDPNHPLYPKGYILMIGNDEIPKFALPDTGSIGVNPLYLLGTLMVALGSFMLIFRRRKENQI